jgi:hypothetical protein
MTPQEKANEIVHEYLVNTPLPFHIEDAKICALIAVDQILNVTIGLVDWTDDFEYWSKVKKEIEKL